MMKIIEWLSGKKTYIIAVLTAAYGLLRAFGLIDVTPEQETAIFTLIAACLGMSIRAGVAKSGCS